jgi:N-acyl homoserine lactone hydrolase
VDGAASIYAFAIEHPEGVIVVDTGETAGVSEPGKFPRWQPFLPVRGSRAG